MSSENFAIGNMADDVVSLTLNLCGKDEMKTLRFPKVFYANYVDRIVRTALDIQKLVFEANGIKRGEYRLELQQEAASLCVYLNHLIRIAFDHGWISEKQRERWQKAVISMQWAIVRWRESDIKNI